MSRRIALCPCQVCETRSDFKVGIKSPRLDGLVSTGGCPITFPGSRLETELGAIRENEVWGAGEGDGNAGDEKIDSKGSGRCGFSTLCTIRPKGARWVGLSDSTFVPSILSGYTTRRLMCWNIQQPLMVYESLRP